MTRRPPYPFTPGDNMTGQCSACGEVFYGEYAFDRHRQDSDGDRICIDPSTIESRPDSKAWWRDDRGRWHYSKPMTPAERARIVGRERSNPPTTDLPGVPGRVSPKADDVSVCGDAR